ncbi:hypothetical protein SAY87_009899 [Trapa incisa]|uniref:Remorin n=1 Tax=Trapa incisa TaxID=236973 RepID=A0AAN7JHI7_9MYRT|nr:hypothetical protein SAY87_009899 [Trapa incisa]
MGEVPEKVESEYPSEPPPPQQTPVAVIELPEPAGDITDEKALVPHPPSVTEEKSGALAMVEKAPEFAEEKTTESSNHRDAVLARLETEKRISLIKAWEESEKSKAKNKAQRKLSAVGAWENSKEASAEAELKKIKEKLEKKKAEYVEKMRNRVALIHRAAEEKRAIIEAKRGEDLLKAEEMAAKYRVKGSPPKKLLGIF